METYGFSVRTTNLNQSMKEMVQEMSGGCIGQTVGVLCFLLVLGPIARGHENPMDPVSVSFRRPSHPGVVKVHLMSGRLTVKGYDGKEVVVEARLRGGKSSKNEK